MSLGRLRFHTLSPPPLKIAWRSKSIIASFDFLSSPLSFSFSLFFFSLSLFFSPPSFPLAVSLPAPFSSRLHFFLSKFAVCSPSPLQTFLCFSFCYCYRWRCRRSWMLLNLFLLSYSKTIHYTRLVRKTKHVFLRLTFLLREHSSSRLHPPFPRQCCSTPLSSSPNPPFPLTGKPESSPDAHTF